MYVQQNGIIRKEHQNYDSHLATNFAKSNLKFKVKV